VRTTIAYQATILGMLGLVVGVPAGIVVGRLVWHAVADGLGVAAEVSIPMLALALVAVGVLLVANLIGALGARAAIHDRPAVVLSGE
jgi:ABC-type antimicrobial peptide transport system permease subunit